MQVLEIELRSPGLTASAVILHRGEIIKLGSRPELVKDLKIDPQQDGELLLPMSIGHELCTRDWHWQ